MKKYLLLTMVMLFFGCNSSILDDPSTIISYSVPEPSHVKITVENSYNTVVAVLVDQDIPAGNYQANFSVSDLAEGIYFYNLKITGESGNIIETTKQMIIIKQY